MNDDELTLVTKFISADYSRGKEFLHHFTAFKLFE